MSGARGAFGGEGEMNLVPTGADKGRAAFRIGAGFFGTPEPGIVGEGAKQVV